MLPNIDEPLWGLLTAEHREQLARRMQLVSDVCLAIKHELSEELETDALRDMLERFTLDLSCALDEDLENGSTMSSWRFFVGWTSAIGTDCASKLTAQEVEGLNSQFPELSADRQQIVRWIASAADTLLTFISVLRKEGDAGRAVALVSAIEVLARTLQTELFRSFLSPSVRGATQPK